MEIVKKFISGISVGAGFCMVLLIAVWLERTINKDEVVEQVMPETILNPDGFEALKVRVVTTGSHLNLVAVMKNTTEYSWSDVAVRAAISDEEGEFDMCYARGQTFEPGEEKSVHLDCMNVISDTAPQVVGHRVFVPAAYKTHNN